MILRPPVPHEHDGHILICLRILTNNSSKRRSGWQFCIVSHFPFMSDLCVKNHDDELVWKSLVLRMEMADFEFHLEASERHDGK